MLGDTDLGESTVVPDVPVVGETVVYVAQLSLLYVLFDGIQPLGGGNLKDTNTACRLTFMAQLLPWQRAYIVQVS